MGVEPTTYTMRTYRSSQLSYYPVYFCDVLNIQLSRKNANQKSRKIEKIRISQEEWHLCGSKARKNPGKRSGAGGGSRTHTLLPAPDFESSASAISPLRHGGDMILLQ